MLGQERYVDTANFVFAAFDNQPAGGFAFPQNHFVGRSLVFTLKELLLGLVLHPEKLADTILLPTKPAQIVATAAFVDLEENLLIVGRHRSKANRVRAFSFGHGVGF